jgi:phage tail-like protein
MARPIFNDKLSTYQFHLLDVDPSLSFPPWVLLPSAGFSAITSPEMTSTTETIKEGTDPFPHHVITGGEVNTITLSKGVSSFNADFWRWMTGCLMGQGKFDGNVTEFLKKTATLQLPPIPGKRRNLMLMHFTGVSLDGLKDAVKGADGALNKIKGGLLTATGGSVAGTADIVNIATNGLIDIGISSVPGKVYMLLDALPVRYKPGTDFDATSSDVSIEELDIQYHRFEEFSLMA